MLLVYGTISHKDLCDRMSSFYCLTYKLKESKTDFIFITNEIPINSQPPYKGTHYTFVIPLLFIYFILPDDMSHVTATQSFITQTRFHQVPEQTVCFKKSFNQFRPDKSQSLPQLQDVPVKMSNSL